MVKRPESPAGMSDIGKACDVLLLDCVEELEVLWEELAILDELGKVQGVSDPYSEAERLEPVWVAHRAALGALQDARAALVGARNRVAARTGWASERRAEVRRKMADLEGSEISERNVG
jgi:hypothetical protein